MGVNKVIYYGEVLVDMSQVTVTPESLEKGKTALDAKGELITGLHEGVEPNGDTLVWDGNTEGKLAIYVDGMSLYHISDTVPTEADLDKGGTLYIYDPDTETEQQTELSYFALGDGLWAIGEFIFLVDESAVGVDIDGIVFPEKGMYFVVYEGIYTSKITINNFTGFPCIAVSSNSTSEDLTAEITEYAELNAELESVINGLPSAGGSGDGSVEFGYFSVDGWQEPSGYETYKIPFMIGQTWDDWLNTALNISVFTSVGMVQLGESNGEIKGTAPTGLKGSLSTYYATEGIVSPSDVIQNESIYYLVVSGGGFE